MVRTRRTRSRQLTSKPRSKMRVEFGVGGERELRFLAEELRQEANGGLRSRLNRSLRRSANPAVTAVRTACRRVDVESTRGGHAHPDKSTQLRRRVADAIIANDIPLGVQIHFEPRRFRAEPTDRKYALHMYLNRSEPRYRNWWHPVFGNRKVWTRQEGEPFFYNTLRRFRGRFESAVRRALDQTVDRLS